MKGLFKKWWFWLIIIIVISIIAIIAHENDIKIGDFRLGGTRINASRGGLIAGRSHEEGGIKTYIKNGDAAEIEGGEAILNKNSMNMNEKIVCEGTPAGIASAVNELGGGVEFDKNGICYVKKIK